MDSCLALRPEMQGLKVSSLPQGGRIVRRKSSSVSVRAAEQDPLFLRAARKEKVERPPAWMMRQAGRYMKSYQELTKKHPSFRERSETTDLIVEITMQPFRAFKPDGVILFSDILTPLDAMGIPFEIDENKGPVIDDTFRSAADLSRLHDVELDKLSFVSDSLGILRKEVGNAAAVLGFVGSPYTLATYCVEGCTTRTYTVIKSMTYSAPAVLDKLLDFLATQIGEYANFQVEAGAQCIQVFDSWGGQLTPDDWERWSKPYIHKVVRAIRNKHPEVPIVLYANGSGGLLERMATLGTDVVGLDWQVDMADGRRRVGNAAVQGNVDPAVLFADEDAISQAVLSCVRKAGPVGHIMNLGHGVLPRTPEEKVAHFFSTVQNLSYADIFEKEPVGATH